MVKLETWEQKLRPRMTAVDLIGELDLTSEEAQEIGSLIAALIRVSSPQEGTRQLERRYPSAFAAYLVFQGGYSYDRGDFWGGVCAGAGLLNEGNLTVAWGQAFERICRKFDLTREFAGHRYVGAILGHGGIPTNSLRDFFEHMLQPSVTKPELAALSTADLILEWLTSATQYYVDKPILRFLEYGGQVAEDFVERCRRMARDYAQEDELPAADEVGLPASLVDAYQEWIGQSGLTRTAPSSGQRLKKPGIVLDPWGERAMHVMLPEQQIPPTQSRAEFWWEIEADGTAERVAVNARRVDMDLKTRGTHAALQAPAQEYRIRFCRQTEQDQRAELLREWVYDGTNAAWPFLAFDPETGGMLTQRKRLPARPLWILCPPDVTVQSEPASPTLIRERLPQLPWAWHTWRGYRLDLLDIATLKLTSGQGDFEIQVVEAPVGLTAELVDGARLDSLEDPVPIYLGAPPTLCIFMQEEDRSAARLAHWRLELNHEWNADPERVLKARLSELDDLIIRRDGHIELPLMHPRFLGLTPVGQYRIRLRGPLGRSADLRFRVAPKLYLTGHEDLYLPEPGKGAPAAHLLIETDPESRIEFLQSEPEFHLEELACDEQARCYQVTVPPDRADAPLRMVRHVADDRSAFIPLRIPIHRLRWLLILKPEQLAQTAWQSNPSTISLAELEQSASPYLALELPIAQEGGIGAQLRFLGIDDALIAELEAPRPTGPARFRRFDLRAVRDALRASQSPAMRVELSVTGLPGHGTLALTILTLRRSITVEGAGVALREQDGGQTLDITWWPEIPLRNRYIRLWSQTRPWAEPLALPIPDAAQGGCSFAISAEDLPSGRYRIEFLVRDPWLPDTAPARPQPDAPNVATVVIGSLEERLAQLDARHRDDGNAFACGCESVFLWHALGQADRAAEALNQCWECRHTASLPQIMALAREFRDQPTGKAFRMKLYGTEQIRQILAAYRDGGLPESLVAEYLADLPPLSKLAPEAGEMLLSAPDERVQLAAARYLIEQGKEAGMAAAFSWHDQGRLSQQGLDELMSLNLELAERYLRTYIEQCVAQLPDERCLKLAEETEFDDIRLTALRSLVRRGKADGIHLTLTLQARQVIDAFTALQLLGLRPELTARVIFRDPGRTAVPEVVQQFMVRHPEVLPAMRVGGWVRCALGWGEIRAIRSLAGQPLLFASEEVAAEGVILDVRLHLDDGFSDSTIQTGPTGITIRTGPRLYACAQCNGYVAREYGTVIRSHYQIVHDRSKEQMFRFLQSGLVVNQAESVEFSSGRPTTEK